MMLQPVVILIPPDASLTGVQRVERQRAFARLALRRSAALTGAADGDWPKDANDAPLPRDGLYWSVSHKPTCAAAVVASAPVGIDVERIVPRRQRLFEAVADEEEWRTAGGTDWEGFFRVWTAKEATLKAQGLGIGYLRECRVVESTEPDFLTLHFRGVRGRVEHHRVGDHLIAVTAVGDAVRWTVEDSITGE